MCEEIHTFIHTITVGSSHPNGFISYSKYASVNSAQTRARRMRITHRILLIFQEIVVNEQNTIQRFQANPRSRENLQLDTINVFV